MYFNSENSSFQYVRTDQFTPNSRVTWTSFGPVDCVEFDSTRNIFTIVGQSPGDSDPAPVLKIYLLGPKAFRVRFNPKGDYEFDYRSYAVVNYNLGQFTPKILQNDHVKLSVDLGGIRLDVLMQPFTVQVYMKGHLISTDTDQGLVYLPGNIPGEEAIANFKAYPANANYFGFGEKAGTTLAMNQQSMTFFNYDNYKYDGANSGSFSVVPGNTQPGPLNPNEPLYNSIPFLIEDNPNPLDGNGQPTGAPYAYGLLLDNESQSYFNIGQSTNPGDMYGKYYFGALYGEIDYYFMAGEDTTEVLRQYVSLVGGPALNPMWSLGYHQGCYGYYDQQTVLNAAQSYRNANVPLDGMHIDVDFQNNYRTFTASPKKFPGGGAPTFQALAQLGVKASTNITGIVTINPYDEDGNQTPYSVLDSGEKIDAFINDVRTDFPPPPTLGGFVTNEDYGVNTGRNPYVPTGAQLGTYGYYADLGKADVRQWWGQQYKPLLDAGLEMVWQDMTDPATVQSVSDPMPWKTLALDLEVYDFTTDSMTAHARIHNVFALNLISATYEGMLRLRKESGVDKRPFIIARGGYTGVHRYAASWTGDSASDWNFLSILIPEILNFGLSGQPMSGADVGGFATSFGSGPNGVTDPELITRWTTMSAFFGWFRNHYDGYNKAYQEPYAYGDPVLSNCRNYIEIRYKLLQYFYDCLYEAHKTGLPICRPLFLTDRQDPNVYQHLDDQFMVGQNILVAPIIQQGSVNRNVYVPAGSSWYAYTDNKAPLEGPSPGGQDISWYVPINLVPIYIRAGAIIPRRELEQYVGQLPICPLTFDIYPGPASTHLLYLDDKVSMQYDTDEAYRITELSQFQTIGTNRVQTLKVTRLHDNFKPKEPFYFVGMLQTPAPISVQVNGAAVPIITADTDEDAAKQLAASTVNAAYYNTSLQTTYVKVFDTKAKASIVGTFPTS